MNFDGFIGNEKIKQQLIFLIESGRLPHAVILEGEEGIGKRTLAKEIALNLLCSNREDAPCRECAQCKKVIKGYHPDVIEYTAAGVKDRYKVDTIREIVKDAIYKPNEADYKIYILNNCQFMDSAAQNALLKTLEEPPSFVIFILTAPTKSVFLETVLSRACVFTLEGVNPNEGAEYICAKNPETEYNSALSALEVWDGNIGKAMQSLSDGKLKRVSSLAVEIAEALLSENEYSLLEVCFAFSGDNDSVFSVMSFLKSIFRDALCYSSGSLISGYPETAKKLSIQLSKDKLCKAVEVCEMLKTLANNNFNNNLLITKIPYELRRAIGK